MRRIDYVWIREMAVNVVVAVFFGNFAWTFIHHYLETGRISSLLLSIIESVLVLLFLCRKPPKEVSFRWFDWAVAVAGTCMFLVIQPQGGQATRFGNVALLVGLALSLASIMSLNRSFGIVAANRGVKRSGLYYFVRHPLYAAYLVLAAGVLINYPSRFNFMIIALHTLLQILRILSEERLLMKDPEYREYALATRYRLIPFVW